MMRGLAIVCLLAAGAAAHAESGIASVYGGADGYCGKPVAYEGRPLDCAALTAAHRTFAFGTLVKVVNAGNGRMVLVRINDRGPFAQSHGKFSRIIDLTPAAARAIDCRGLCRVTIERLTPYGFEP